MEIKYAGVVPLIGGMMLGMERALGTKPEYIMSYEAFSSNDSWLKNYWNDVPFHMLDDESSLPPLGKVQIVGALCPCAGLSSLNSAKSRGSNAPQNEWMYKSSELVLEKVQPEVLWGENAPALFAGNGVPVVDRLIKIADKYGYSFSILRTDSSLHGIPQRRQRTFYFFWKSPVAPILEWVRKEMKPLEIYLEECKPFLDKALIAEAEENLRKNSFYTFFKEMFDDKWREPIAKHKKSLMDVIFVENLYEDFIKYVEQKGDEGSYNRAMHAKKKRDMGKNYWDFSPFMPVESTGALNGARMNAIHPTEERYFLNREFAHMMCIPNDMEIPEDAPGKIFQNVPAITAEAWSNQVVKFVKGELELSKEKFLKQDNTTQTIRNSSEIKSTVLF
jgi:site-specific DNA-cytosine methylase